MKPSWVDRVAGAVSPAWQLRRMRSRMASELLRRNYEAASTSRRTEGWRKSHGDANALIGPALATLRAHARDLVRNNPYAESALSTIVDHAVGWGIVAKILNAPERVSQAWTEWAETTACDADGKHDLYGLQKLIKRTVVESGEVLVRRRWRRLEDGFPIPVQLQVLDPDFLDTTKDTTASMLPSSGGRRIIQGVEFDGLGRRIVYHLHREHPGSTSGSLSDVVPVPASEILHIFRPLRPGQVRGPSWFAPVLTRFKDFDEFEDATLMKQKIAACLAVLYTDPNGTAPGIGTLDAEKPELDFIEPGMMKGVPPGFDVKVVDPPSATDYGAYASNVLRAIATGLGVTYEDLTGDYQNMPFSAARMSRLRHWARVEDWRWRILIPQFCDPVFRWAMEAANLAGIAPASAYEVRWSAPPAPMVDPANEALANIRLVRSGQESWQNILRERGYDPDQVLQEIAEDNEHFDELGITLDSDPRKMTQAGQLHTSGKPAPTDESEADKENDRMARVWPRRTS